MRVSELSRDLQGAPVGDDPVVVELDGKATEIAAVEFRPGKVVLLSEAAESEPTLGLSEQFQKLRDEVAKDGEVPGFADIRAAQDSGAGIVDDLRGRNEGSLQTTESPGLNPEPDKPAPKRRSRAKSKES